MLALGVLEIIDCGEVLTKFGSVQNLMSVKNFDQNFFLNKSSMKIKAKILLKAHKFCSAIGGKMSDYEVDELFTGRFSLNYKNITEIFIIVHLTPYIRHIQKKI